MRGVSGRAVAAALSAGLWTLPACSPDAGPAGPLPEPEEPGLVHVHGLGINPGDELLYAATHTGLFRLRDGEAERVGESYRDIMGFTVAGPDRFLGSGHPGLGDAGLPPLLGLMESTDAGRTWEPLSLLGEADFHALGHIHGRIYGYDSGGERFMASEDGVEWEVLSEIVLLDFAVSPEDPERILATTERGLVESDDGGRTWSDPRPAAPPLVYLAWQREGSLRALDAGGGALASDDGGATWTSRGSVGGPPEALLAHRGVLYAAAHGAGILRSDDDGATWSTLYREAAPS